MWDQEYYYISPPVWIKAVALSLVHWRHGRMNKVNLIMKPFSPKGNKTTEPLNWTLL